MQEDLLNCPSVEKRTFKQKWFTSPAVLDNPPFPIKYILLGISFPIIFVMIEFALDQWTLINYRPWLSGYVVFSFQWLLFISMLIFAVTVCKKHRYWPLFQIKPFSQVQSEFLNSLLLLIPTTLIIGLSIGIAEMLLGETSGISQFRKMASFGFNSWYLVFTLVLGFTVGPVIEEIFFRGYLYNALKSRTSLFIAIILQATIFSVYHQYDFLGSLWVFLFGVVSAILYEKRKNLFAPIFLHCLSNALIMVPALILALQNFHSVSKSWEEARQNPSWLLSTTPAYVERRATGIEQWEYTIDTWGSRGLRKWKMEANAFKAIPIWFPEDRKASAKATLGIVLIYSAYLRDDRRAILVADELIAVYPDQKEQSASAWTRKGWSHYLIKDFEKSREAFQTVLNKYFDYKESVESAEKGLEWLHAIDH